MDLPGVVERREPERNLAKRIAQAPLVQPRRAVARKDRRAPLGNERRSLERRPVGVGVVRFTERQIDGGGARREMLVSALSAQPLEQIDACNQLHREERAARVSNELAEGNEVRMVNPLKGAELVLEARDSVEVVVPQRLQGDAHVALDVERLVHDPHPAFAYLTKKLESRWDGGARLQHSRGSVAARRAHTRGDENVGRPAP